MNEKFKNRWIIVFFSVVTNLIIGSAYAWSVFQPRLIEQYDLSTPAVNLAFTFAVSIVPFSMMYSAKLRSKIGASKTIFIGGLLFATGFAASGFTRGNLVILYLSYGLLCGIGTGFINGSTLPNSLKWFPDKRGLAGGIVAGGYGGGAIIFAPVFRLSIEQVGINQTFIIFGIAFGIILALCAGFIKSPPTNYVPQGFTLNISCNSESKKQYTAHEMLKQPTFFAFWFLFTLSCISGLMIIAHGAHIAEVRLLATPTLAAVAVMFISITNAGGRVLWGAVSDKIGRFKTLKLMYLLTLVMFIMLLLTQNFFLFVVAVMGISLCYGGAYGVFPPLTLEFFGVVNFDLNYGIMLTAFGFAGIAGPQIAAQIFQHTGSHSTAFALGIIMSVVAITTTYLLTRKLQNN